MTTKNQKLKPTNEIFDTLWPELAKMEADEREEIATKAGCHKNTLYNWAFGATHNPYSNTLIKVARAMGYEVYMTKRIHQLHRRRRAA